MGDFAELVAWFGEALIGFGSSFDGPGLTAAGAVWDQVEGQDFEQPALQPLGRRCNRLAWRRERACRMA